MFLFVGAALALRLSRCKQRSYNHIGTSGADAAIVAAQAVLLQFFDRDVLVGEYANIAGDIQCFFDNLAGLEVRVLQ